MRTLCLDCGMGAAGDMLAGALAELLPDKAAFETELNSLGLPGVEMKLESRVKCGLAGTHLAVRIHGHEEHSLDAHGHDHGRHPHVHRGMGEIRELIAALPVSPWVRENVLGVYRRIAQAESKVHGVPVEQIHFHEVGSLDAVADITAVCLLMEKIAPQQVIVSPVHVGSGRVHCAHGILPVPAPATAEILRDVPVYGGAIQGELCTPTGAALLKHFAASFGDLPVMRVQEVGYGMGNKDFPIANCVRAMLGETADSREDLYELQCNLDDMTGEELGFAMEQLFTAGAVEVFTTPVGMKKSRPGVLLTALCREDRREALVKAIFRHTSTLGIRESRCRRYVLHRENQTLHTPYGEVSCKRARGWGVSRRKYEYEDLARIAREKDLSISQVREAMEKP